jgi:N6-adenosine-specific RNA methylase IME4
MKPETQPKAHLWLWVLSQHTDWGHEVALAWGFDEYVTMLTWNKPGLGTGQFQCNTEHILLYRKGGSVGNAFGKTGGTGFRWPRPPGKIHSAKPPEAYALCERVSPGPYYEMYARQRRENWTQMGDQLK